MNEKPLASINECFGEMSDPRVQGRCEYCLIEIIIIAICAVIAGANSWVEVETFGRSKESWLRQFLGLKSGIPSHDTFGDVFGMIDAEEFQRSFMRWIERVFSVTGGTGHRHRWQNCPAQSRQKHRTGCNPSGKCVGERQRDHPWTTQSRWQIQ